jgi:hypothetical protein
VISEAGRDARAAADFYGRQFGWTTQVEDFGSGPYTFQVAGRNVAAMLPMVGDQWLVPNARDVRSRPHTLTMSAPTEARRPTRSS